MASEFPHAAIGVLMETSNVYTIWIYTIHQLKRFVYLYHSIHGTRLERLYAGRHAAS